ncbi:unnamed protein product [Rotaria magnacalcarata]|uniref:Transmembrane protein 45B n=1 Tax=Rotaria magnacalcarata TaxID=392030 RepID=A0A815HEI8_9BILA|nr:unnamed protein product [Rotaria magnacalcarata]
MSFIGHIAPGIVFVLLSLWWHVNNCLRYFQSLGKNVSNGHGIKKPRREYRGSTTYPCWWLPCQQLRNLPIESIIKIIITTTHFTIEVVTGYNSAPRPYLNDANAHHTAMLFGFFLGAWVEMLMHYKVPLPPRSCQVMGVLGFAVEATTMVFHLHARTILDAHGHVLLAVIIVGCMLSAIGECFNPNCFWFVTSRNFFALMQGTWFLQLAFVIYPQTTNPYFVWDEDSHRSVSLLTMSFSYHMSGNALVLLVVYLIMYKLSQINGIIDDGDEQHQLHESEYKLILNDHDDEQTV